MKNISPNFDLVFKGYPNEIKIEKLINKLRQTFYISWNDEMESILCVKSNKIFGW